MGASNRQFKKPVTLKRPKPVRAARAGRRKIEEARGAVPLGEAMQAYSAAGRVMRADGPPPAPVPAGAG